MEQCRRPRRSRSQKTSYSIITRTSDISVLVNNVAHNSTLTFLHLDINSAGSPSSDGQSTGSVTEMAASSTEAKARRKAQNRAAQRAFRERKEKYVQELEGKIKDMEAAHKKETSRLLETNHNLMSLIQKLEAEIATLKSKSPSFTEDSGATKDPSLSTRYSSGSPHSPDNIGENNVARLTPGTKSVAESDSNSPVSHAKGYCGTTCRTTKDGISFCAKLKEEVCSSAFERLLSEHIFDNAGEVNNTIEPVPIVTSPINSDHKFSTFRKGYQGETEDSDEYDLSSGTSEAFKHEPHPDTLKPGRELITCSQVWERLCEHPQFEEFDIEELCSQLKTKAKCSGSGPVLEEGELQEVLEALEAKLASDTMAVDDDMS
ncbi:DNA-binding transcription factor yap1 [Umbelopsis sp. WA50703]